MTIKLDPSSNPTVLKIKGLGRLTREALELSSWQTGRQLKKNTSDDILKKPKGGRTYVIRTAAGIARRHVASAPGETHANLSGALRRSLGFSVKPNELEFGYFNPPKYGEFVEFGTRKMSARPSLRNNITSGRRDIMNNIENAIKGRLK